MSEPKSIEVLPPEPQPLALSAISGVNVEALLAKAIDAKSAVEVLERLMVMRREARAEAAKEAFDRALAEFQRDCPTIAKTKKVYVKGALRYCYAPLEAIIQQVKELLQKHGFSYALDAIVKPGWVLAQCKATHAFGHSQTSSFEVPIDPDAYMNEAQKFASALTFAKRYAFCNAFGILTGDEDDDSGASGDKPPKTVYTGSQAPKSNTSAPASKPAASPTQAPAAPQNAPSATPKPKVEPSDQDKADHAMFLTTLRKQMGNPDLEKHVIRYLQSTTSKKGVVMLAPWEKLEDLQLVFIKGLVNGWENAYPAIELWLQENSEDGDLGPAKPKDEPWRSFSCLYGKADSGVPLGELPKSKLFGWWLNFKVETKYNGKAKKPETIAKDVTFREMLDEAGKHYAFKVPADKKEAA